MRRATELHLLKEVVVQAAISKILHAVAPIRTEHCSSTTTSTLAQTVRFARMLQPTYLAVWDTTKVLQA